MPAQCNRDEKALPINACACITEEQLEQIKRAGYLLEFKAFYRQSPFPGWERCYGELLEEAAARYPKAWAELQKEENAWLLKTEEEWQDMQANFPPDEFSELKGIGGVPYFVLDREAGTLRLPDLRGLYAEASGFDGLEVGGVHGDAIRSFKATFGSHSLGLIASSGAINGQGLGKNYAPPSSVLPGANNGFEGLEINPSRVIPTANKNQPRAFGVLPCVYLGR